MSIVVSGGHVLLQPLGGGAEKRKKRIIRLMVDGFMGVISPYLSSVYGLTGSGVEYVRSTVLGGLEKIGLLNRGHDLRSVRSALLHVASGLLGKVVPGRVSKLAKWLSLFVRRAIKYVIYSEHKTPDELDLETTSEVDSEVPEHKAEYKHEETPEEPSLEPASDADPETKDVEPNLEEHSNDMDLISVNTGRSEDIGLQEVNKKVRSNYAAGMQGKRFGYIRNAIEFLQKAAKHDHVPSLLQLGLIYGFSNAKNEENADAIAKQLNRIRRTLSKTTLPRNPYLDDVLTFGGLITWRIDEEGSEQQAEDIVERLTADMELWRVS